MLTLGLFEGVFAATIGILLLVGAANENAPLHRVFGPIVILVLGGGAYGIHAAGVVDGFGEVIGLAFFGAIAFVAPVAVMRFAWKATRDMDQAPAQEGGAVIRLRTKEPEKRRIAS